MVEEDGTPLGLGRPDTSLEAAIAYRDFLMGPHVDEIRELAEEEQRQADADPLRMGPSNQFRLLLKKTEGRTYKILVRDVSEWTVVHGSTA